MSDNKDTGKQERRNEIVDAAMELFAEKGFHEVTMDTIAERVGLSKGTLYLYFKNKEALFFSIIRDKTDILFNTLTQAVNSEQEYKYKLEKFITNYLSFFDDYRYYFKIIHSEKSRVGWESKNKFRNHAFESYRRFENMILQFVKEGIDCGYLRNIEPEVAMKALRGILSSFTLNVIISSEDDNLKSKAPEVLDVFLNGAIKR